MPVSFERITEIFKTEKDCLLHLASLRWPDGTFCPRCGSNKVNWLPSRNIYWCGDCKKQFSVRIGTVFEGSRIPMRKWFMTIWLITSREDEITINQIAEKVGVSQKSASFILSKVQAITNNAKIGKSSE